MYLSALFVLVSFILSGAIATNPGNNALRAGLSDELETAIHEKYGPVIFDGLTQAGCDFWMCNIIIDDIRCMSDCYVKNDPICALKCSGAQKFCTCITCFPPFIVEWLRKSGICHDAYKKELFRRAYLGIASPEEISKARELGYNPAAIEL